MRNHLRTRLTITTAVTGLAALLVGSSGFGGSGSRATGAGTVAAGGMARVRATETEFKIVLSRRSFVAGSYEFVAVNDGKIAHSLEINGPGVSRNRIAGTIMPGRSKSLIVKPSNGSYQIFCPVDGHKGLGMDVKITVGSGTLGATTTTTPTTTTAITTTTGGYHY